MNLKKLSDKELLTSTINTVKTEKKWTTLVLEHLQEVENRKLYCELQVNSLFAYCTKILGYSEAEASVRVNATRLIVKTPTTKKAIETGELSLTNASYAQSFFRDHATSELDKKNIIDELKGKSTREAKDLLEKKKNNPRPRELVIKLNERLLKKIDTIQKDMDLSELEVIEALMDEYLAKKKAAKPQRVTRGSQNQRYITRRAREAVYSRAHGQCEAIHPETKKRCAGRTQLEFDHLRPIAIGGNSETYNLQLLCRSCNQRRWVKQNKSKEKFRG